jgi:nucleoside-diphosphate-sugar epimerase
VTTQHVVFGGGPLGREVARQLAAQGHGVRLVSRSGPQPLVDVETRAADIADPKQAVAASAGADVLYHCMNADYGHWSQVLPPLMDGFIAAAQSAGATAVYGDNLYTYGPISGPIHEDLPTTHGGRNVRVRTEVAELLLEADRTGRLRAAVGRSSDFYGPGVLQSSFGDRIFPALLGGKPAQVLGNPDLPHTFTFIEDFARALTVLGTRTEACGKVWHVPSAPTVTVREMVTQACELAGVPPRISVAPSLFIRALGLVNPTMRAVAEVLYQAERPWVVDHSRFEAAFGTQVTPHAEALERTLAWYRGQIPAASLVRESA